MVLYFTGTGNSRYAAEQIGTALQDEVLDLFDRIRSADHTPLRSEKPWVLVCPTYAWQIPRVLRGWFLATVLEGSKDIYFVMTCGGSIGAAGKKNRMLCRLTGMNYKGTAEIIMPENYIAMFSAPEEPEALRIVAKAEPVLRAVADAIAAGEELEKRTGPVAALQSSLVNSLFYAGSVQDKPFRTDPEKCVGCGRCAERCPLGNITLEGGLPQWNGNCTHCMACICLCPQGAIEYGKKSVGKRRYLCPDAEE